MNRVIIAGNIGRDAETRYTPSGTAVSNFSVATSRKYKKGEETVEETEWHNCVVWQKEKLAEYLTKGTKVVVEGRLKTDQYEKDGVKMYRTQIVVEQVHFMGKAGGEGNHGDSGEQRQARPSPQSQPAFKNKSGGQGAPKQAPAQQDNYDGMQIDDSDIPF
jgi:single-strand DNA-binding protein